MDDTYTSLMCKIIDSKIHLIKRTRCFSILEYRETFNTTERTFVTIKRKIKVIKAMSIFDPINLSMKPRDYNSDWLWDPRTFLKILKGGTYLWINMNSNNK